jgi:hypothetical protein
MDLLKIVDTQYVPVDKIDFIGIDNDDRRNLLIHTVGDKTIINHYTSVEQCMREFNYVVQFLKSEQ